MQYAPTRGAVTLAAMDIARAWLPELGHDRSMRGRERRIVAQALIKAINITERQVQRGGRGIAGGDAGAPRRRMPAASLGVRGAARVADAWYRALTVLEKYKRRSASRGLKELTKVVEMIVEMLRT